MDCESQNAPNLEEPLLLDHGNSTANDKTKARACDTSTPYENAGLFSSLTFYWLTPLFALGVEKKTLDLNDVPQLGTFNSVFGALPHFQANFNEMRKVVTTEYGLAKAFVLAAWKEILWTALMALIYTSARYVIPYLIDSFVQCLNGTETFKYEGYILAVTFSIATFLEVFIRRHWIFKTQQVAIRLGGVTTVTIYNKCLTLPSGSSQLQSSEDSGDSGSGEVTNLVAVDVEKIKDFIVYMHDTWLIVLQIVLALLILYKKLGFLATVGALIVTVGFMLINSCYMKWQNKFQTKLMESKDNRMKATKEILRNMRVLKFQGWEMNFLSKILQLRALEMQWLKKYLFSGLVVDFFYSISPTFVALVTFGSCIYLSIPLELGKILSALATFRVLQGPIFLLPDTISMSIQARVSLKRIASFLSLDELENDAIEKIPLGSSDTSVEIIDGNFSWDNDSSPTLKDINIKVNIGMKVGICGVVGSGKSSLLSCILGEMPRISGGVKLCGTMAYVAQSPWIQSGTVQENILFGKEMDLERYDEVLRACCLKKDLEILSFGDQTVIGERGINLSGGQKQRIQIARALYHDVDIYLFDDPFSAVDAHTGSHLYKEVVLGLLKGKTVIYVTHQVEFLNLADQIVVMKNGRIAQMGRYKDILLPGSAFTQLVDARHAALSTIDFNMVGLVSGNNESMRHVESDNTKESSVVIGEPDHKEAAALIPSAQLVKEEDREKGRVGFSVYWKYITTAYGGVLVFLLIPASILLQSLQIGSTYWLAWASPTSMNDKPLVSGSTFMIVYASLVIGSCFGELISEFLVLIIGYKTATILFSKMLRSIFRAPMSFFDATPTGRILSRCSTDQSAVETQIPSTFGIFIFTTIQVLGTIAIMSMVAWQVLIIFIPLILASIWYQRYYMPSSRELSRLSGVCEAPVIQFFSETIYGMTTIRSFDRESRFRAEYMKIVDAYARPKFYSAAAMKWLMMRLDTLSCITFAFLLVLSVYFADQINPAIAGLAVTYALTLNDNLSGLIWCLCHAETKMISVERIFQYLSITSEAPLVIQENRPELCWPSHGEIDIHSLQVQYAPHLPLVLHDVNCIFPGGMKTGIVGRTGSGKSTLIQALFRIIEPTSGRILIDGVDISSIGLQDLRSRLSIIPQDPTMFQGTIRSNLDPLEQYTDEQIWDALHKCQLGDEIRKMDKKLDSDVHENGENWSMGQRQLICLGRVLLKKSKVLVLDEATASVDSDTDNLIQQTLKLQFSDCTVIIIAHRVTSVLDSSMVLLLSHGVIEEYDSPMKLLQNKSSSFSQLVAEYTTRSSSNSDS